MNMGNRFSHNRRTGRSGRTRNRRRCRTVSPPPPERRGRSDRRRRSPEAPDDDYDDIPPPAPSPPPAYEEYPVSRSPPPPVVPRRRTDGGRTTAPEPEAGYDRYTSRRRSPSPSPFRASGPRRVYLPRPYAYTPDDFEDFMTRGRDPVDDPPPLSGRRPRRRPDVAEPEFLDLGIPSYHAPEPREDASRYGYRYGYTGTYSARRAAPDPNSDPNVWYDRPDCNGFRPARTFDTGFAAGPTSSAYLRNSGIYEHSDRRRVYVDPSWPGSGSGSGFGNGGGGGSSGRSTNRYRDRSSGYFRFSRR
ncbi:hypothetical protein PV08_08262 [Exophiala spinifera]|uniref:Uncharacterized protein n=1 Tax=Exophiala spinifera TaxID=91928 RepID=A0A0D2B395_9EURO|nr:uncharacterized protein PV08_08262 [Exophiala spinifera]KIW13075.1 hypothetical protein PV08_08262 [Exophiala spinifera]